jgi:hypothetical protein
MKHYNAPALVAVGLVVELTQGSLMGADDSGGTHQALAVGSVGFNL